MSVFDEIPLEVREIIWELCVCVPGVLVPYLDEYKAKLLYRERAPHPTLAITMLSKGIRQEVLPILFERNTWGITGDEDLLSNHTQNRFCDHDERDTLWRRYGRYIRHANLRYTHHVSCNFQRSYTFIRAHEDFQDMRERSKFLHDEALVDLRRSWWVIEAAMDHCVGLKTLRISVADLYCPTGCCRFEVVEFLFRYFMAKIKPDVAVLGEGFATEEERKAFFEWRGEGWEGEEYELAMASLSGRINEH